MISDYLNDGGQIFIFVKIIILSYNTKSIRLQDLFQNPSSRFHPICNHTMKNLYLIDVLSQ